MTRTLPSLPRGAACFALGLCLTATALAASESLIQAPAAFKNAPAEKGAPLPAEGWWTIFHDSELDSLETLAARANQDLAQAVARIGEAREQTRIAAADFLPHAELGFDATRQRLTDTGPIQRARLVGPEAAAFGNAILATQAVDNSFNDFRTPLTISYEVDVFGRIRHTYGSARAAQQAVEADRRAVALSLGAEVANGYFMVRALDTEMGVLQRAVALRRDAVQLNQERVNAGLANALDLSRAKVELDNTLADLNDAVRLRAEMENNLAALCGQPASDFHVPPRPLTDQPPPAVPAGVPSALLARRPDLAEAERRLAAANEQIGVARAQLLPTFDIGATGGFESGFASQLFDSDSRALAVVGTVSIPIFEGGRNTANLRAARERREEALDAYRSTALTAFKEVETALSDLRQRTAQLADRDRAAAGAQDVLDLSQKRYIEGAVSYFEVVDAERSLLAAQLSRVQTLDARYTATISLVRALGGGWQQR